MGDENNIAMHGDNRKLEDVLMDGWTLYEFLDETTIETSSSEYRTKVREAMEHLELATTIVSQIGMFSANELIDEVSTESLAFLLLPYFLGKLALKRNEQDRIEALNISEIYFRDFLQRCHEYDLCKMPKFDKDDVCLEMENTSCIDTKQQLVAAAMARNDKITQYKRKRELEDYVKRMRVAVRNQTVEDEVKREFYLKFIQKSIIDTNEEIADIQLEKGVLELRKQNISNFEMPVKSEPGHSRDQGHGHSHGHFEHHKAPPKPKPMQPFIITRDAAQKAVFGLGYPSLPVMTVDDFYRDRVEQGIFPDAEKMSRINQEKALAAMQDPEIAEEKEKAEEEIKEEEDDPEYIDRMRRMDEYKDVVRRGDGNRHNRS